MNSFRKLLRGAPVLLAFCVSATAQVQIVAEDVKIVPDHLHEGEYFGSAIAASGSRFAASEPFPVGNRLRVYRRGPRAWELEDVILPPQGAVDFGWDLAMQDDVLAVGDPSGAGTGYFSGNVTIYRRSGSEWILEDQIHAPSADYWSGSAVALDGDRLLYGTPGADYAFEDQGAVEIYERQGSTWVHVDQLAPSDPAPMGFGSSLALQGDLALVGAPGHSGGGAIYVFERRAGIWLESQRILIAGAAGIGHALALEGDVLVVGDSSNSTQVAGGGAAFLLERGFDHQWHDLKRLSMPDLAQNDQAGWSVDLQGARALVGTRYGSATYVYGRDQAWNEVARLVPAADVDGFTANLKNTAFAPSFAVVGNWTDGGGEFEGGAVFVYETPFLALGTSYCHGDGSASPCPCGNEAAPGALTGCRHSGAIGGLLYAAGSASIIASDLAVRLQDPPWKQFAMLFAAPGDGGGAGTRFGDGLLCIGGPRRFLGVRSAPGPFWGPGFAVAAGFAAGETWFFQCLIRDPAGPCGNGFNSSNALAITMTP